MSLNQQLQEAIEGSGVSLYAVSQGAKVDYATIYRYMTEDTDIRLSTVEALTEYFQMHLTRPRKVEAPPDRRRKGVK